jgi:hypothetical protein
VLDQVRGQALVPVALAVVDQAPGVAVLLLPEVVGFSSPQDLGSVLCPEACRDWGRR